MRETIRKLGKKLKKKSKPQSILAISFDPAEEEVRPGVTVLDKARRPPKEEE